MAAVPPRLRSDIIPFGSDESFRSPSMMTPSSYNKLLRVYDNNGGGGSKGCCDFSEKQILIAGLGVLAFYFFMKR